MVYVLPQSRLLVDVYTVYVLPQSRLLVDVYSTNSTGASSCRSLPTSDLFGLFLIWPCLVLVFLAYYAASSLVRYRITWAVPAMKPECNVMQCKIVDIKVS